MSYVELKSCPHCGCPPRSIYGQESNYWVECPGNGEELCGDWYSEADSKEQVAVAWNKRAMENPLMSNNVDITEDPSEPSYDNDDNDHWSNRYISVWVIIWIAITIVLGLLSEVWLLGKLINMIS